MSCREARHSLIPRLLTSLLSHTKAGEELVGRSPGRLGDIAIPRFVPLQEFCSPIRLQHLSVQCKQTFKCCNLIGLQNSCSGTNLGIVMSPNLLLFRVEVGLRPTREEPGNKAT